MITWQKLTVWVGCGIVGNSLRSSDLLMAPVSLNCYKKERDEGVLIKSSVYLIMKYIE